MIADLSVGPLHDAAVNGGAMLLVGALNPLTLSREERQNQKLRVVTIPKGAREEET